MVITDLRDLKNVKDLENEKSTGAVEGMGREKLDALKVSIIELKSMISQRERLSREVINDGEKVKMDISNFLVENKIQNPEDPVEAQERSALRRKKVDICEIQMNEKVNCWRDIALLKKELRENEGELSEKESRLNMLNDILNDETGGNE